MNVLRAAIHWPRRQPALALVVALQASLIVAGGWAVTHAGAPHAAPRALVLSGGEDAGSEYVATMRLAPDGQRATITLLGAPGATLQLTLLRVESRADHAIVARLHVIPSAATSPWVTSLDVRPAALPLEPREVAEARASLTVSGDAPEEGIPVTFDVTVT